MKPLGYSGVRKRILMFYFAAVANVLMALFVMTSGSQVVARGTLWLITAVFLGFAAMNYLVAKNLRKRWETHVQEMLKAQGEQKE